MSELVIKAPQVSEEQACIPVSPDPRHFNPRAKIPFGCTSEHIRCAMNDFIGFLGANNQHLHTKNLPRLESILMPANFSSIVGEFMSMSIPKYCDSIVKNRYHNGHPDLIPKGFYPGDAAQHCSKGIEIKGSRYLKGWQGHNPEECWLMVFVFVSNRPPDLAAKKALVPFEFLLVVGAQLTMSDWIFSGRKGQSRRTITASVTKSGAEKMLKNWIYRSPSLKEVKVAGQRMDLET